MHKMFQIPVLLNVSAENYGEACVIAGSVAENIKHDKIDHSQVCLDFERDGSSINQRVLYLHNENDPLVVKDVCDEDPSDQ